MNSTENYQHKTFPSISSIIILIKPITWFPPMWAFLCGAVSSSNISLDTSIILLIGLILSGPIVCGMSQAINDWCDKEVDAIVGVESRGFLFGMLIANALKVPFIPVRKAGKLPHTTIVEEYALEYGTAKMEIHTDAIKAGWNIVVHDDLLATGGTAVAASKLVQRLGGNITSAVQGAFIASAISVIASTLSYLIEKDTSDTTVVQYYVATQCS